MGIVPCPCSCSSTSLPATEPPLSAPLLPAPLPPDPPLPPPLAPPAPPPPPPIHTSSPSRVFRLRSRWRVRHWTGDQAQRQPRPHAESDGEPSEARALEANESTTASVTHLVVSRQYRCATRVRVEPAAAFLARAGSDTLRLRATPSDLLAANCTLYFLFNGGAMQGLHGDESSPWRQRGAGKSMRGIAR